MPKLIYFTHKLKNFCHKYSKLIDKKYFSDNPDKFQNHVAVIFGLSNYLQMKICKENNINFIYIDNAYFGNLNSYFTDKKCKKNFYRVVFNDTSLNKIKNRDDYRFNLQLDLLNKEYNVSNFVKDYKFNGKDIILIPPSGMVPEICKISADKWCESVTNIIKNRMSNNIIIRDRSRTRYDRFSVSPIHKLFENAYCVVTFNSTAAVDALLFGVPSFIYNTSETSNIHSPAEPVSNLSINDIANRIYPENRLEWLHHLSYGQFSREEMWNGFAREFVLGEK